MGTARLAQLALTILLSTYPLSELLKFRKLGDQRFETFSKQSTRILRSNAGIHDTPPAKSYGGPPAHA
ncbi:hypothetical protein [Bradyrhizobium japonicum]|uniref:hypothetical protein n=1 Tax=Bradyrhizobium japonicum TaxID=375 RepID=UPI001BACB716|nr:hypothetical protein [Bradyrhizobium japonicum]MBR0960161.1 hypothetical protein [Bradyrhizobium japonicum]